MADMKKGNGYIVDIRFFARALTFEVHLFVPSILLFASVAQLHVDPLQSPSKGQSELCSIPFVGWPQIFQTAVAEEDPEHSYLHTQQQVLIPLPYRQQFPVVCQMYSAESEHQS